MGKKERVKRQATFGEAIFVLGFFAIIVAVGSIGFKFRVEPLMCLAAVVAGIVAYRCGYSYTEMEEGMCKKVYQAAPAMFIIWTTGMVMAAMMFSGSIPMVIYYGLKVINPQYLYLCAFLICCLMSVITGTSWGSAGTIGLAMFGVAQGLGVDLVITAAAVISGAIFGDKLSPLSETTNLAPLCAGTTLYEHIGSMFYTTIPTAVLAGVVYFFAGRSLDIGNEGLPPSAVQMMADLDAIYDWNILLLLPFVIILVSALLKWPPVPSLFASAVVALLCGALVQGFNIVTGAAAIINGFTAGSIYDGTLSADVLTLLNRGGMKSMVGVMMILFCGYTFIGVISATGILNVAVKPMMKMIKGRVSLIFFTLFTDLVVLLCSGSSYPAHIVAGEMFKKKYIDLGLDLKVLSRSMEDVGTMIAPLVPWGSSGAFYIATFGVAIWGADGYALWAINTWFTPVMAMICAITGFGMIKMSAEKQKAELEKYAAANLVAEEE